MDRTDVEMSSKVLQISTACSSDAADHSDYYEPR